MFSRVLRISSAVGNLFLHFRKGRKAGKDGTRLPHSSNVFEINLESSKIAAYKSRPLALVHVTQQAAMRLIPFGNSGDGGNSVRPSTSGFGILRKPEVIVLFRPAVSTQARDQGLGGRAC